MIYVAHPFSGKRSNQKKIAFIVKMFTRQSIHAVYVSPIHAFGFLYDSVDYDRGMQMCLELLKKCNSAIFCHGWEKSKGCNIEMEFCKENKIPYIVLDRGLRIVDRSAYYKGELK